MDRLAQGTPIATGRAALERADWHDARVAFEAALAAETSAEALEGLGWALWWSGDSAESLAVRERACGAYARRGERARAGRVALGLAIDSVDLHGEAVVRGWLERARAHLEAAPAGEELALLRLWQGQLALHFDRDLEAARARALDARRLAVASSGAAIEPQVDALEGLILVAEGRVAEGMPRLDAALAAVLAGEISDLDSVSNTCCLMIYACEHVRDADRAEQWHRRVAHLAQRWRVPHLLTVCRIERAALRMERGAWDDAEVELREAAEQLAELRPRAASEAWARLGELRRRQGRRVDAEACWQRAEAFSLTHLGRAAEAFESDHDLDRAERALAAALRRVAPEDHGLRATALELEVRLSMERGEVERAHRAASDLATLATRIGTAPFAGPARAAAGEIRSRGGDPEGAIAAFEEAVEILEAGRLPYQSSRARLRLAQALAEVGRSGEAARARQQGEAGLARLRGERPADGARPPAATASARRPTARELEVLRLVAEGIGDRDVARRLGISEHTVHRHVANLLAKLDAASRAAAVARAARLGLL